MFLIKNKELLGGRRVFQNIDSPLPKDRSGKADRLLSCKRLRPYFQHTQCVILPRKEGVMVLELTGTRKNFKEGVKYLEHRGVQVQNASQEIKRIRKRCTHCGVCTSVCPTGALSIQRPEMSVDFNQTKCSVCELCITACPTRAMEVRPSNKIFFK